MCGDINDPPTLNYVLPTFSLSSKYVIYVIYYFRLSILQVIESWTGPENKATLNTKLTEVWSEVWGGGT